MKTKSIWEKYYYVTYTQKVEELKKSYQNNLIITRV